VRHTLAQEAPGDYRQWLVSELARHRIVVEAAAALSRMLAPEEGVEPPWLGLTVVEPLQRLALEGPKRELEARGIRHLLVACALHRTHQARQRERVRAGWWLVRSVSGAAGGQDGAALHGRRAWRLDDGCHGLQSVHQ
jgi:hypothetical protein